MSAVAGGNASARVLGATACPSHGRLSTPCHVYTLDQPDVHALRGCLLAWPVATKTSSTSSTSQPAPASQPLHSAGVALARSVPPAAAHMNDAGTGLNPGPYLGPCTSKLSILLPTSHVVLPVLARSRKAKLDNSRRRRHGSPHPTAALSTSFRSATSWMVREGRGPARLLHTSCCPPATVAVSSC